MNRLKAAIQELRDHLGADSQGRALLDQVSEIANAQRKRAAALEESSAGSESLAKALRGKLDASAAEIERLKNDLHRETARRSASEGREQALLSRLAIQADPEPDAAEQLPGDAHVRQVARLLLAAQRRFKQLPTQKYGKYGGVMVEDFVKSFSQDEFAGLGMALAACAFINLPVTLRAKRPISVGKTLSAQQQVRTIRWIRGMVHASKTEQEILACFEKHDAIWP